MFMSKIIKAKKSLGQNFLKSNSALNKIIETSNIKEEDFILEIGPGKGALTKKILEKNPKKLICIEKDSRLIFFLEEEFKDCIENKKLEIIEGDILDINIEEIIKTSEYKLIANIPYYITGQIIENFLSQKESLQPTSMTILVQKEVAERIVATDKRSILSNSVKIYGDPKYISTVKNTSFKPKPKVDSAILFINNINKKLLKENDIKEEDFFKVLKTGFSHKRKRLLKNLKDGGFKISESDFEKLDLDLNIRAEKLCTLDWTNLTKLIK